MKTTGNNSIGKSNAGVASKKAFRLGRFLLGTPLILLLAGATPGAVGSCSKNKDDATLDAAVITTNCEKIELYICAREWARADQEDEAAVKEYQQCTDSASVLKWCPSNCIPTTKRRWDACFSALSSTTTLDKENPEDIPECVPKRLCQSSTQSNYDEGELDAGDNHDN
jgi:hypothetical protein